MQNISVKQFLFSCIFFYLFFSKNRKNNYVGINTFKTIFWSFETPFTRFGKTNTLGSDFFCFEQIQQSMHTCLPVFDVLLEHCTPGCIKKLPLVPAMTMTSAFPLFYYGTGFPSIDFRPDTPISPSISHVLYCSSIRNKSCNPATLMISLSLYFSL